jgi:hypothetical protein
MQGDVLKTFTEHDQVELFIITEFDILESTLVDFKPIASLLLCSFRQQWARRNSFDMITARKQFRGHPAGTATDIQDSIYTGWNMAEQKIRVPPLGLGDILQTDFEIVLP